MKKPLGAFLLLSISAALFFTACHKEEKAEVDNETQSAVDNAIADQEYMAIVPATNSHAINTKGVGAVGRVAATCDSLTKISGDTLWGSSGHVDPTYTMNISNASCALTMADGRIRTGAISVRLTGKIKTPASQMIIKLLSYKAAGVTYSCDSMVVTTVSSDAASTSFNIGLVNGVCQSNNPNNPWNIKYHFNKTITLYPHGFNGSTTGALVQIYGTASGTNRSGRDFSVEIPQASPLVKVAACQYISSGIMKLTPKDFALRIIDFGYSISPAPYGGCDEDASYTVNGSTVAFKLK